MQLFLAPQCLPFAIAAVMLFALTGIELLCLLLGFSMGEVVDKALPDDHDGLSGLTSWLNVGRVPVLILLMLLLGLFAMSGFVIQIFANALWSPLPALLAVVPAIAITLPAVRASSRTVARLVPRDETYAVELADFVGRIAEVTVGPLDQGLPGRIRLKDQHGNWHVVRAKAASNDAPIAIGTTVLIVDRVSNIFVATVAPPELIQN